MKKKEKKYSNKAFSYLFIAGIILAVIDLVTTMRLGAIVPIVELNPVYRIFGSFIPVIFLNVLLFAAVYWLYTRRKSTPAQRFFVISWIVLLGLIRIFAIHNAISWHDNFEPTEENIAALEEQVTPELVKEQQWWITLIFTAPVVVLIGIFKLWEIDHKVEKRIK